ncbi:MAG: hypothetical protein GY861_22995 [bacterium]|nr:hypothetical protein [bacterium]
MEYRKRKKVIGASFTVPFIYSLLPPILVLDLCVEIYHRICFRIYRIPTVKRSDYIKIDRHKLEYLTWFDKINCAYCGYANGFANYLTQIAGDTEKYWCGIKHQQKEGFNEPAHHKDFAEYGDEKAFKEKYCKKRR